MSNSLPKPRPRKPLPDADLLRFVDAAIFGEQFQRLTQEAIAEARGSQTYKMLHRVGCAMYRAGEAGLRPRPQLMVVDRAAPKVEAVPVEAVPVDDEQPQPETTTP